MQSTMSDDTRKGLAYAMYRESAYNYAILRDAGKMGQDYSRAFDLCDKAFHNLAGFVGYDAAREFAKSTYASLEWKQSA